MILDRILSRPPAGRRRSFRRAVLVLASLLLAFIILSVAASILSRRYDGALHDRLAATLGRPVALTGFALGLPIRIEELVVAGDGLIDTGPLLVLRGLSAWPDLASLLRGRPRLSSLEVDSATLVIRQAADGGWSTAGLFPEPAVGEPVLPAIRLARLSVTVATPDGVLRRTGGGDVLLGADGAYAVHLFAPDGRLMISHAAPGIYRFEAEAESIPLVGHPHPVRAGATWHPESGALGFRVASLFRGESAVVAGDVLVSEESIRCDSGVWSWGRQSGRFKAGIEDRVDQWAYLEVMTPVTLAAADLGGLIDRGVVEIRRATMRGRVGKSWTVEGDLKGSGIHLEREVRAENLGGEIKVVLALGPDLRMRDGRFKGRARFDRLGFRDWIASKGEVTFEADRARATISGAVGILGGSVRTRDLRIALGPGLRPVRVDGRIVARGLGLAAAGFKVEEVEPGSVTADLEITAAAAANGEWTLDRVAGAVERIDLAWRGEPAVLQNGKVDLVRLAGGHAGEVSGNASFLGAEVEGRARIEGGSVIEAEIRRSHAKLAPIRNFFGAKALDEVLPHLTSASFKGLARRLEAEGGRFAFKGELSTADFTFETVPRSPRHHVRVALDADYSMPDSVVTLREAFVAIDGDRTRLTIAPFTGTRERFQTEARLARLDPNHLKAAVIAWFPDRGLEHLRLAGGISGSAQLSREEGGLGAEIKLAGDLLLRDSPFVFEVKGNLSERGPNLRVEIKTISLPALYASLADLDPRIDRGLLALEGTAGGTMGIISSDHPDSPWQDLNIEGLLNPRSATIDFPEHEIGLSGVDGEIPFRLRGARLMRIPAPQSRPFTIKAVRYGGLLATDFGGMIRFNEKNIIMDTARFRFAEGRGHAAFAIDFPTWDAPRLAAFGRIDGCSVGIIYRTMQPFQGVLEGAGSATFELKMDRGDLEHLKVDGSIEDGILGAELLREIVVGLEPSMTRNVLASLEEWHFKQAAFDLSFQRNYYSPQTARQKFRAATEQYYEVLGNISIRGTARSESSPPAGDASFLHRLDPINIFFSALQLELKLKGMQLRLLMDRVGRRRP